MGCGDSKQDEKPVVAGGADDGGSSPDGTPWYIAVTPGGEYYWYTGSGYTTWQKPQGWVDQGQTPTPAPKKKRRGKAKGEEDWDAVADSAMGTAVGMQVANDALEDEGGD